MTTLTPIHTLADTHVHAQFMTAPLVSSTEKERRIQNGQDYSEVLSPETPPAEWQRQVTRSSVTPQIGALIASLGAQLHSEYGPSLTLVSLARAGIPLACALQDRAALEDLQWTHHSVSVLRREGIDAQALQRVIKQATGPLILIDGWTGKGSVEAAIRSGAGAHLPLAVACDPAGVATHAGTHADLMLPWAAQNSTVSGLLSRSFWLGEGTMHGMDILNELRPYDQTAALRAALLNVSARARWRPEPPGTRPERPADHVRELAATLNVTEERRIKCGVGESTRAFLRRDVQCLLIRSHCAQTKHLSALARERHLKLLVRPNLPYAACVLLN